MPGSVIDSNDVQSPIMLPIDLMLSGTTNEVNDIQFQKTPISIFSILFGRITEDNDLQFLKLSSPIVMTLSGIIIEVNDLQL